LSALAANRLQQQYDVDRPNEAWVMDLTHIRKHEGWFCLAMVIDLYSRKVVG
jgi:putative transposase